MSKIFKELENIKTLKKVDELFNNYDDGDLFLEKTYTENFV